MKNKIENYWLFEVRKIIDLHKFVSWAKLNLSPEKTTGSIGELSPIKHRWVVQHSVHEKEKYEKQFKNRLFGELMEFVNTRLSMFLKLIFNAKNKQKKN